MNSQIDQFFALVAAYRAATGLAEATVSARVLNDGKRIGMIRAGRDIGVRRFEEACRWFAIHWPPEAIWPDDVPQPEAICVAAGEAPAEEPEAAS